MPWSSWVCAADGTKELVSISDGHRESTESWADVLRGLKRRGMTAPVLAVGDGALGFWGALSEVFPETAHQRCWVHKMANVMNALPKSAKAGDLGQGVGSLRGGLFAQNGNQRDENADKNKCRSVQSAKESATMAPIPTDPRKIGPIPPLVPPRCSALPVDQDGNAENNAQHGYGKQPNIGVADSCETPVVTTLISKVVT